MIGCSCEAAREGDGLLDRMAACGDGSVVWYRNIGSKTEPRLAKGVTLVQPAPPPNYDDNAPPSQDHRPGVHAKMGFVQGRVWLYRRKPSSPTWTGEDTRR